MNLYTPFDIIGDLLDAAIFLGVLVFPVILGAFFLNAYLGDLARHYVVLLCRRVFWRKLLTQEGNT